MFVVDEYLNASPADRRETERQRLLRRLAHMVNELRAGGTEPPSAFVELLRRNAPRRIPPPTRA